MVLINYAGREINAKIVYYGPGLSGKTTNLECIYASVPSNSRGKMVSMKTRQDRTLFFDFLPLELGEVHGFRTRFLLYTVPGQVFYNATRKLVLKGADAVVFVADSTAGKLAENAESLRNLEENLRENNLSLDSIPWVLQYNKRDLAQIHSIEELQSALNPRGVPHFEAAAATGRGVYETLHAVSRLLFQRLMSELRPNVPRTPGMPAAQPGSVAGGAASSAAGGPGVHPQVTPSTAQASMGGTGGASATGEPPVAAHGGAPAPGPQPMPSPQPRRQVGTALQPASEPAPPVSPSFGVPAGNTPAEPTSAEILDSVQATSEALQQPSAAESAEPSAAGGDYGDYGHVVDLSIEMGKAVQEPNPEGFIKDPLRCREPRIEQGRATTYTGQGVVPAHTFHVPSS